jgi:hypothetical protein
VDEEHDPVGREGEQGVQLIDALAADGVGALDGLVGVGDPEAQGTRVQRGATTITSTFDGLMSAGSASRRASAVIGSVVTARILTRGLLPQDRAVATRRGSRTGHRSVR